MRLPQSLKQQASLASLLIPFAALASPASAQDRWSTPGEQIPGERLDPSTYVPGVVEDMQAVLDREAANPDLGGPLRLNKIRKPEDAGSWRVPSIRNLAFPHSGERYIYNAWGDLEMSIEFPAPVVLEGAFIAGHGGPSSWAAGLTVRGYRDGQEVAHTLPFHDIDATPTWFAMDLAGVDRVVFYAQAPEDRDGAWYGLDDLTFSVDGQRRVLDFEDLGLRANLTGTDYAGLGWPAGGGSFAQVNVVPPPVIPPGLDPEPPSSVGGGGMTFGGGGTLPPLADDFIGPNQSDAGAGWIPPDTHGAIGPDHFISVVNQHMSVYDRDTSNRLINVNLRNFFSTGGQSAGDPRVAWDHHAERWIIHGCNFNASNSGIYLAVSTSSDATGSWFKTFVQFNQGSDSNRWTDYPTLGFDANGIYAAAYMVGNPARMSIFAIDKAPLIAASPSLGTVTAFRDLPYERAIQPCVTYDDPGAQYFISTPNTSSLRIRRLTGPLTNPSLTTFGNVNISTWESPPGTPQSGSSILLGALDGRLMNAVFRNDSIWAAHGIKRGAGVGRAAARWYEVSVAPLNLAQEGTVRDQVFSYSFPAIDVNVNGDVGLGLSAFSPDIFGSAAYTGRLATDPPGEMATPVIYKAGLGPYTQANNNGVSRWGDYSQSNLDPRDNLTIWTIQEYARNNNSWGTWVAAMEFPDGCPEPFNYCSTSPNSVGAGGMIELFGSNRISQDDFQLQSFGLPPMQVGIFYYGPSQIDQPFGNGRRCVGGTTYRLPIVDIDIFGFAFYDLDYNNPPAAAGQIDPGETWNFQFWYRDPAAGGAAFNLTNALSVTFCP